MDIYVFTYIHTCQMWHNMMVPFGQQLSHQKGADHLQGGQQSWWHFSCGSKSPFMLCCSRMLIIEQEICLLYQGPSVAQSRQWIWEFQIHLRCWHHNIFLVAKNRTGFITYPLLCSPLYSWVCRRQSDMASWRSSSVWERAPEEANPWFFRT